MRLVIRRALALHFIMDKKLYWREFWILWGLGVVADATGAFIAKLPVTPLANYLFFKGYDQHQPWFVGLEAAEIVVEMAIVVGVGLLAAHAVGLGAPLLEALLRGERSYPSLSSLLVPTLLVGIAVGSLVEARNLPVLRPNREASQRQVQAFLNSPDSAKAIAKLMRFTGPPLTPAKEILLDVAGAISAAPYRLFWISGFAWIFTRIKRTGPGAPSGRILCAAIFAAAVVSVAFHYVSQSAYQDATKWVLAGVLLPRDPRWAVTTRNLLNILPWSIGLGWLYTRKGIECTVVASLVAQATQHLLLVYVIVRFFH
jgi:hypothetical protein